MAHPIFLQPIRATFTVSFAELLKSELLRPKDGIIAPAANIEPVLRNDRLEILIMSTYLVINP
ncbi:hypothetical protein KL86DYS1_30779 [uncultured Dysgonomonas sp.]|uniref:Uncharacterized protein n=1 Tax=uncultured Dysgonomonas sp. TaxID=206096 RepID=A0A212JXP9_9BACT|nr:hypothetical protein KL86DYS1_30779 [uncultured Dysgonomonas sp.]